LEEHTGVCDTGAEEANDPSVAGGMRTEQRKRIGVATGEQGVNLSVQLSVKRRVFLWRKDARKRRGRWLFFFRHEASLRSGLR
jgi:hypothetical protein